LCPCFEDPFLFAWTHLKKKRNWKLKIPIFRLLNTFFTNVNLLYYSIKWLAIGKPSKIQAIYTRVGTMHMVKKPEGEYTPTVLQSALGEPLRSEQRTNELLPRVLSRLDLFAIFIAIVLFIPNASVVQATEGAGPATYFYWVLGAVTFLLPGAIVTGQLNRFMPVDGSIYVWTHRAMGPLLGFFAGFCAWFPGVLVLLSASDGVVTLLQGIFAQILGAGATLLAPWQQGVVVLIILLVAGWVSTLPLRLLMRIIKAVILVYVTAILVVGLAGAVWLLKGHTPQLSLTSSTLGFGGPNIVLYGVIVLALLGIEVPLNVSPA